MKYAEIAFKIYQETAAKKKIDANHLLHLSDFDAIFDVIVERILKDILVIETKDNNKKKVLDKESKADNNEKPLPLDEKIKDSLRINTLTVFQTACSFTKDDTFYNYMELLALSFITSFKLGIVGTKKSLFSMPIELSNSIVNSETYYREEMEEDEKIINEREKIKTDDSYYRESMQQFNDEIEDLLDRRTQFESSHEDKQDEIQDLNNRIANKLSDISFALRIRNDEEVYKKEQGIIKADLEQAKSKYRLYKSLLDLDEKIRSPEYTDIEFKFLELIEFKMNPSAAQILELMNKHFDDKEFVKSISDSLKEEEAEKKQNAKSKMWKRTQADIEKSLRFTTKKPLTHQAENCIGCNNHKAPRLI